MTKLTFAKSGPWEKLEYGVFGGCESLTEITLPNGLGTIGDRSFLGCGALEEPTLPSGLKSVGRDAFAGCERLTVVAKRGSPGAARAEEDGVPVREP